MSDAFSAERARARPRARLLVVTARNLDALYRRDLKWAPFSGAHVNASWREGSRSWTSSLDFIGSVRNQHIGYG